MRSLAVRLSYAALAAITVAAGLAVHYTTAGLAPAVRDVVGDALWAMMIFWIAGIFNPRARVASRAAAAVAVCFAVEASQLLGMKWLIAVRNTTPGHLVLGNGFDPRDLVAYSAGVAIAAIGELAVRRRRRGKNA
jgi:uncharacterized protein DUF2809